MYKSLLVLLLSLVTPVASHALTCNIAGQWGFSALATAPVADQGAPANILAEARAPGSFSLCAADDGNGGTSITLTNTSSLPSFSIGNVYVESAAQFVGNGGTGGAQPLVFSAVRDLQINPSTNLPVAGFLSIVGNPTLDGLTPGQSVSWLAPNASPASLAANPWYINFYDTVVGQVDFATFTTSLTQVGPSMPPSPPPVPLPASLPLLACAFGGLAWIRRSRQTP